MSISSLPQRRPTTEQVAAEVRALMGRHNVTQMQLRDVLGVSQTGISKRLRGLTPFDANEIGTLADFFHVEPGDLFGHDSPGIGPPGSRASSMSTGKYVDQLVA